MPLTFFTLPPETRNMIYELLFVSGHRDKAVTPDPVGSRKSNDLAVWRISAPDSLALLQTCRQINDEASSILYGTNVFFFSDVAHGIRPFQVPGFGHLMQWCDYVTMYAFLSRIGCKNRAKILRLRLEFLTNNYVTYADEVDGPEQSDISYRGGGANVIGDALELLSSKHNLSEVEILFERQRCVGFYAYVSLFSRANRKLRTRLAQLQGIREVRCFPMDIGALHRICPTGRRVVELAARLLAMKTGWYEDAQSEFLQLKAQMEYKPRCERELRDLALRWQQEWKSISDLGPDFMMPVPGFRLAEQ